MSVWDHENWITNFDCICCQNFNLKTKFILGYIYIYISLGGLHNTHVIHVLNYTRNVIKKSGHIKHQKTFLSLFFKVVTKH